MILVIYIYKSICRGDIYIWQLYINMEIIYFKKKKIL